MTIVAEITIRSATFSLGRAMGEFSEATIELERVVPVRETVMPLLRITDADVGAVETTLRSEPRVESVTVLTTTRNETLFEVDWSPEPDGLIAGLLDAEATVLDARGTADSWDFRLRFPSHDELSAFNLSLTEAGTPVTLRRIYQPPSPEESPEISSVQLETLVEARRRGYFEVPRRINQADLAAELGISDSALSQRIRRGVSKLVETEALDADRQRR